MSQSGTHQDTPACQFCGQPDAPHPECEHVYNRELAKTGREGLARAAAVRARRDREDVPWGDR